MKEATTNYSFMYIISMQVSIILYMYLCLCQSSKIVSENFHGIDSSWIWQSLVGALHSQDQTFVFRTRQMNHTLLLNAKIR